MARLLVVKCPSCGKAREMYDASRRGKQELGDAVKRAAADGLTLDWAEGTVQVGCSCESVTGQDKSAPATGKKRFRFNLRQVLLIVTTIAVLLTIFRHPISLLFDERVLRAAAAPWAVYGWFFFGWELIKPTSLPKNPMCILMFSANIMLAVLVPFWLIAIGVKGFGELWQIAKDEK